MRNSNRIFWGLILIGSAVFLILSKMGLITPSLNLGMIIVGLFSISILVSSIIKKSFGGVFFSLGLAWLAFDKTLGLPNVEWPFVLLIVILLTIGFNIIFPKKNRYYRHMNNHLNTGSNNVNDDTNEGLHSEYAEKHHSTSDSEQNGYIFSTNSFGATAKYINTVDFRGADLKNSFGEMRVYFDGSQIIDSPVTINVSNSFGSMKLFIPQGWDVKHNVSVFAGDFRENNSCNGSLGKTLYIEGNLSFGEIQVTYIA